MENPRDLKRGDKIILTKGNNSNSHFEGRIVEIISPVTITPSTGSLCVKDNRGRTTTFFYTGVFDIFVHADRKNRATAIKKIILNMQTEIKQLKTEYTGLIKFKSDEDEVADKIFKLSKARSPKAIAEILKLMKKSDYL